MAKTIALSQTQYRFYADDAAEGAATALEAQNTSTSINVHSNKAVRLRVMIDETGGVAGASTDDYQLQYSRNNGAFTDVTTTSSVVRGFNSSFLTDGGATTSVLTGGTGSHSGEISETGLVTDFAIISGGYAELVYSIELIAADLVATDSITFRVLRNGGTITYSVTPTATIVKVAPPTITGTPPDGTYDVAYSWTPTVTGEGTPLSFSIVAGSLPTGLTLSATTGAVTGTPTKAAAFDPATLFAGTEAGGFWDINDLSTLWQDSAGTIAAAVDQPVGRINDKSDNANHLVQSTTASKPVLRQDANSKYYLETDGVDDRLQVAFTINQPWDRIGAIHIIAWTVTDRVYGGASSSIGDLVHSGTAANGDLKLYNGTFMTPVPAGVGTNVIITERANGANSQLAKNNEAYITSSSGTGNGTGLTIGSNNSGGEAGNNRYYGTLMIGRTLTDQEITDTRNFFAGKSGVTL